MHLLVDAHVMAMVQGHKDRNVDQLCSRWDVVRTLHALGKFAREAGYLPDVGDATNDISMSAELNSVRCRFESPYIRSAILAQEWQHNVQKCRSDGQGLSSERIIGPWLITTDLCDHQGSQDSI